MAVSYATDIRPKFRPGDIACMKPKGIQLGNAQWMCDSSASFGFDDHGNARVVYAQLSAGNMPPDGAWSQDWLNTYQQWIADGFQP